LQGGGVERPLGGPGVVVGEVQQQPQQVLFKLKNVDKSTNSNFQKLNGTINYELFAKELFIWLGRPEFS
jgi:hypothetical protein